MPNESDPQPRQDDLGVIIIEEERLQESFTQIPNTILKRKDISPGAKLTYVALLSYAWQAGSCFPGQTTLSEDIGVGQRSVVRYMKELQDSGLLDVKRRGLGRTNLYTLSSWVKAKKGSPPDTASPTRAQASTAIQAGTSRSASLALLEVPRVADQQVPIWRTEEYAESKQIQSNHTQDSNIFESKMHKQNKMDYSFSRNENLQILENDVKTTRSAPQSLAADQPGGFTAVADVIQTRHKVPCPKASDGSGAPQTPRPGSVTRRPKIGPSESAGVGGRRSLADQATPDLAAVMSQVSDELHDDAARSSLGRAVRLWQQSQASEGNFIAAVYAARKIAKQRGDIEKRASGEAGGYGFRNRMPYFLRCLEDQLGLKQAD